MCVLLPSLVFRPSTGVSGLPVVHQLCHELEDGSGACWVVVPQLDGSLQDGHVGRIPEARVKDADRV